MSSINRKLRRRKEKEQKKKSKQVMKEVGEHIAAMPKNCRGCGIELDKTDHAALDEWKIKIFESGRVDLTCGQCSTTGESGEESV